MPDNLLLDTCAVVWLAKGSNRLSATARKAINQAPRVFVSAISSWEIGLKAIRGNLELPTEPEAWFSEVLQHHNLILADLTLSILNAANRLPWHHKDPTDRFIIATAFERRLSIVTSDTRFESYGATVVV